MIHYFSTAIDIHLKQIVSINSYSIIILSHIPNIYACVCFFLFELDIQINRF